MSNNRPIFVLDTNVIIDYVDVIPGEDGKPQWSRRLICRMRIS